MPLPQVTGASDTTTATGNAKSSRLLYIGAVVLLAAALVVISLRDSGPRPERVYVERAQLRRIESLVTASGDVEPKLEVNISAHVIGKIERLYFAEGDVVRRGQKLVDLEREAFVAQRERMRAEVANRRIEVTRARAALGAAELDYKRALALREQGIQPQELVDRTRIALENARAAYASAEEGVRQARASLDQSETDLSRTTIVSPIDGKVVQMNAQEGEVVVTGTMNNPASVIAVIADLSQILVEADVGETEVVSLRPGMKARLDIDAIPDHTFTGHVIDIGSSAVGRHAAGAGVRYFRVKVAIDDRDDRLRPGMTAQVSIVTKSAGDAIAVPAQSVIEKSGAKKHVLVVRDGKTHLTEVTTGIGDATHVAVLSGIRDGDLVVTGPFRTLRSLGDGKPVDAVPDHRAPGAE